jgi:hypothetical protein
MRNHDGNTVNQHKKATSLNYDANSNNSPANNSPANKSPEQHAEFVERLVTQTVAALNNAKNNPQALATAIQEFLTKATAANLKPEEMEDILGVNEPSIMDLADLSEADEDVVIDTFESFLNQ